MAFLTFLWESRYEFFSMSTSSVNQLHLLGRLVVAFVDRHFVAPLIVGYEGQDRYQTFRKRP